MKWGHNELQIQQQKDLQYYNNVNDFRSSLLNFPILQKLLLFPIFL